MATWGRRGRGRSDGSGLADGYDDEAFLYVYLSDFFGRVVVRADYAGHCGWGTGLGGREEFGGDLYRGRGWRAGDGGLYYWGSRWLRFPAFLSKRVFLLAWGGVRVINYAVRR